MSSNPEVLAFIEQAIAEDLGTGDLTGNALLPKDMRARGLLRIQEPGIVCGVEVAADVFQHLDSEIIVEPLVEDGEDVGASAVVLEIEGSARAILAGERVALNILGRLSGISTLTQSFVREVEGTGVSIVDTRKTTPLLRLLEKYAVRMGGGENHRFGLFDAVLVKDNHLDLLGASGSLEGMEKVLATLEAQVEEGTFTQVEVQTAEEAMVVARGRVDSILFDNFRSDKLEDVVEEIRKLPGGPKLLLEASGGVILETARLYALTGVDRISVGALTHSVKSLDVSLEVKRI